LTSCMEEALPETLVSENSGLCINAVTDGLTQQYEVTTRGTDIKTSEEQEIKTLHVFIFDKYGDYLDALDAHRYQGYRSITGGKTVMNIDREGWANPDLAEHATVIAVANVEQGTFTYTSADTPPSNIRNKDELLNFIYKPTAERAVTALPESGMPMFGIEEDLNLTSSSQDQSIDITMRALMARVDVTLQINSNHTDVTGALPSLTVEKCEVLNAPLSTKFIENQSEKTDLGKLGKKDYAWQPSIQTIRNQNGQISFTFYTFENIQEPANPAYKYPKDVTDDMKQRYKPELADKDNSMAFRFSGTYVTYNGGVYDAEYTLYLGANHTDDFKVMRNKQYKNNITIKGIENVGTNTEHVTFDARVNIQTSNPYFVSMLKERTMDSHFNVVPMDVYFFQTNSVVEQSMTVEILPDESGDIPGWIRFEKVSAEQMYKGEAPNGDCIATGDPYHAGNGKRKYFTVDLVTETLKDNTSCEITASRDRVYLYVDENLDVWHLGTTEEKTRTATLRLTYKEKASGASDWTVIDDTRTIAIEQAKLLEVTFHASKNDGGDETHGYDSNDVIYIEAYEEYLDYGDPLDEFGTDMVYNGLPWEDYDTGSGTSIGDHYENNGRWNRLPFTEIYFESPGNVDCSSNFYWGHSFTQIIAEKVEAEQSGSDPSYAHLTLNTKPKTAAGYCFLKNKRDANGNVPNHKWYLPGIRELERILEDYYIDYKEFQNNFYWSSAAGEGNSSNNENLNYARATKAYIGNNGNFQYYESGTGYVYTGENGTGGFAPRKTVLRIRAARIDAEPQ